VGEDNKLILVCHIIRISNTPPAEHFAVGLFQWGPPSSEIPGETTCLTSVFAFSIATCPHLSPRKATHHQRMSMSSTISLAFRRDRSALFLPSLGSLGVDGKTSPRYHPAPSRNEIAVVQPVLVTTCPPFLPCYVLLYP